MRFTTRSRVVFFTIVPCYLMILFLMVSFVLRFKESEETATLERTTVLAGWLGTKLSDVPRSELPNRIRAVMKEHPSIRCMTIIDAFGLVTASDGSAEGDHWTRDLSREQQMLTPTLREPFVSQKLMEVYRPFLYRGKTHVLRVGIDRSVGREAVIDALRWFLPGWAAAFGISLMTALLLTRLSLKNAVASLSMAVSRVADGHHPDAMEMANLEPSFGALRESLTRLFRSCVDHRNTLGIYRRNMEQMELRLERERLDLEEDLTSRESEIRYLRDEAAYLRERGPWAIVQLDERGEIVDSNHAARNWLSLGPRPQAEDLPAELTELAAVGLNDGGDEPLRSELLVRHPLLGRERRLKATCLRLGSEESWMEKRVLLVLEERQESRDEGTEEGIAFGFHLGRVRERLVEIGRQVHAQIPEQPRVSRLLVSLGETIRDLDVLTALEELQEAGGEAGPPGSSEEIPRAMAARAEAALAIPVRFTDKSGDGEGGDDEAVEFRGSREDLDLLMTLALETVGMTGKEHTVEVVFDRYDTVGVFLFKSPKAPTSESTEASRGSRRGAEGMLPVRLLLLELLVERIEGRIDWDAEEAVLRLEIPCEIEEEPEENSPIPRRRAFSYLMGLGSPN